MGNLFQELNLPNAERLIVLVHLLELALRRVETAFELIVLRLQILQVRHHFLPPRLCLLVDGILLVQDRIGALERLRHLVSNVGHAVFRLLVEVGEERPKGGVRAVFADQARHFQPLAHLSLDVVGCLRPHESELGPMLVIDDGSELGPQIVNALLDQVLCRLKHRFLDFVRILLHGAL